MSKDLFSTQAATYREFRPTYPEVFFDWLASNAGPRRLAWDCGCGSGQATAALARRFTHVAATDPSQAQLDHAPPLPNVDYRCESAEASSLADGSVDLLLVAQALHWFNHARFFAEARRVGRPGGLFAALSYNLPRLTEAVDRVVDQLYWTTLAGCWAPERRHVEEGYRNIGMPFAAVEVPLVGMRATWAVEDLLGYLRSWSAVQTYRTRNGVDPVSPIEPALRAAWGPGGHSVRFPLTVLAGRF